MRIFGLYITTRRRYKERLKDYEQYWIKQRDRLAQDADRSRDRLRAMESELWKRHGEPFSTSRVGNYNVFNSWWCKTCRAPWPCVEAQLVAGSQEGDLTQRWEPLASKRVSDK